MPIHKCPIHKCHTFRKTGSWDPENGLGTGYWLYDIDKDGGFLSKEAHLEHIAATNGTMKIQVVNQEDDTDDGTYTIMVRKLGAEYRHTMPKEIDEVYSGYN